MSSVNIKRQTRLIAYRDIDFADQTTAVTMNAIHLPAGARVLSGFIDVTTANDSGTSAVVDVGDTVGSSPDVDRYSSTPVDVSSAALIALDGPITSAVIPNGGAWITVTPTFVGTAATEGAYRLHIEYVVDERQTEFHAYRG